MTQYPNSGDSEFPFAEELKGVFDSFIAEEQADAEWGEELTAETIASENRVMDALLATGDPLFTAAIGAVEAQREADPTNIKSVLDIYASYIGNRGEGLPPEMRQSLRELKQALLTISSIAIATSPWIEDVKREVQLRILEDDALPHDSKTAALLVTDELVSGEGIDLSDADEVLAAFAQAQEERQKEEKTLQVRQRIAQLFDEQTDFLELHHIHPNDPVWGKVKRLASHVLSVALVSGDVSDQAGKVFEGLVQDNLSRLRLSLTDYRSLNDHIEQLYRDQEEL